MRKTILIILLFPVILSYGQGTVHSSTDLEDYFNLCLEFGAPMEVVRLFQPFRTEKLEQNNTVSYVVYEDNSLLHQRHYSEYQIWYVIDKDLGLYQSTLFVWGENSVLQPILTSYLRRFSQTYGDPVYINLDNGSILILWYSAETYTVKARLVLDIVNPYKFVSITYCSPQAQHIPLLTSLYELPKEILEIVEDVDESETEDE
jgi:hypothetical protein